MTRINSVVRYNPITVYDTQNLTASNTTAHVPIFNLVGTVKVLQLGGIVTVALGSNQTAAYWRLNDGTNTPAVSLATGTTISSFTVGSSLVRNSIASVALAANNASQARVQDPVAATAPDVYMPFEAVQLNGTTTNLEFTYTTTNTPTSGQIQFFVTYIPISQGSGLTPL